MAGSILGTGVKFGLIGFALGFFGPMILSPTSGNGPMLGIFITGPLGFVLGIIVGYLRRRQSPEPGQG